MQSILLIFFNQVLFTTISVLAGYHLKAPTDLGVLICQTWILGYLSLRVCAVLFQMKILQNTSILKSISVLSIFNIILTVASACIFLGEPLSSIDVFSILLTMTALFLV